MIKEEDNHESDIEKKDIKEASEDNTIDLQAEPDIENKEVSNDSQDNQEPQDTNVPAVPDRAKLPERIGLIGLQFKPLFPNMIIPLIIDRSEFQEVVKDSLKNLPPFIGATLMKPNADADKELRPEHFYSVGVIGRIVKVFQQNGSNVHILLDVISRIEIKEFVRTAPFPIVDVNIIRETFDKPDKVVKALTREIISSIKELIQLNPLVKEELTQFVSQVTVDDPSRLADFATTLTTADSDKLQGVLETFDIQVRLEKTLFLVKKELDLMRLQAKISKQIEEKLTKNQRDFFLREQLREIKKELGISVDEKTQEIEKLVKKAARLKMPKDVRAIFDEEIKKVNLIDTNSPEFGVSRNYLDWLVSLPWGIYSKENFNLDKAEKILERDHYGLEDIKERMLEFIATLKLKGEISGSIICFVGPPGVGKTSVGKSIASALNRPFYRFSLGGMRDEAEIKGHRRTYIGAMPGKFIQAMKTVKKANPVIMLDEIDKIGNSFHGDPASALLEVLDPEQNFAFVDHYLDVPFDLSKVMFIATANQLDTIPSALLDRMDVMRIAGYITKEKIQIAKKYLVPKQKKQHGIKNDQLAFIPDAIEKIIDGYAREAGVRNLEKNIGKICRKVAFEMVKNDTKKRFKIDEKSIAKYLKMPLFENDELTGEDKPGCINGLAWTSMGGSVLLVESVVMKSEKPGFKQSGQLGKVMIESSEIAFSYCLANAKKFDSNPDFFNKNFIHLHVPAGAVPKDGPSAGITMATSLISLMLNKPIISKIGMTGELTLNGFVLPIGGLKEKVIAAKRAGINQIICPKDNQKDYEELPDFLKNDLTFHFVKTYDEVVSLVFKK